MARLYPHDINAYFLGKDNFVASIVKKQVLKRANINMLIIDKLKRNHPYGNQFRALCEKWLKSHGYLIGNNNDNI